MGTYGDDGEWRCGTRGVGVGQEAERREAEGAAEDVRRGKEKRHVISCIVRSREGKELGYLCRDMMDRCIDEVREIRSSRR
jgi:hypothetical protein